MAGANNPKPTSQKPPSSSSNHRKSRWESNPTTTAPTNTVISKPPPPQSSSKPSPTTTTANINNNNKPTPSHPSKSAAPITPSPSKSTPTKTHHQNQIQNPNPNHQILNPHLQIPSFPDPNHLGPPPPPSYGFHMLDRRTIVLADGSVRSYFALPPDYQDFTAQIRPPIDPAPSRFMHLGPMSPDGFGVGQRVELYDRERHNADGFLKRKFVDEEREREDDFARHRQQLLQYGNPGSNSRAGEFSHEMRGSKMMRVENVGSKNHDVDQKALKVAFLRFVKVINENANQRKVYLEDGKQEPVKCVACGRSSKDFPDMHGLIMHTFHSDNSDLRVDHLGLHKALCILMGWNYSTPPDNSKAYQYNSPEEAAANQSDLIMWPPLVIIHNTCTGKDRDGRMDGLGNKVMDAMLRDLGCQGGKSKALYGKDGHLGTILVKFASDKSGLNEAFQLAEYFDRENHGRRSWAHVRAMTSGKDDENNPNLVMIDERSREKKRILYGYLGTAADLEKVDSETRKKVSVESLREYFMSSKSAV